MPHLASFLRLTALYYTNLVAPHCLCSETLIEKYSNKSHADLGQGHSQGLMLTTFGYIEIYYLYPDNHQSLENALPLVVTT